MSPKIIDQIYDPNLFSSLGKAAIDSLTEFLTNCQTPPHKALPYCEPNELLSEVRKLTDNLRLSPDTRPQDWVAGFQKATEALLSRVNKLHSPHYMGHQVNPSIPLASLFEYLGTFSNQPTGVYEMGPFSSVAEKVLAQDFAQYIGWNKDQVNYDAIVTHGGSMANLTAILAARNVHYSNIWNDGLTDLNKRPIVITSKESHYSIARAAGIVGVGANQVVKCETDSERRINSNYLQNLIKNHQKRGDDIFCVVATAGTTPTGAFDPIDEIADICNSEGIWLHVDAAHGGGYLLSEKYKNLMKGIDRADSVTWDAHKMMFVPALCTFLFFKQKAHSYMSFSQDAPYLFSGSTPADFDPALRTIECTKRPLALGTWILWSLFGPAIFSQLVERVTQTTRDFYHLLEADQNFKPMHSPQCNILCFQFNPSGHSLDPSTLSDLQLQIRKRLIENQNFYITSTVLDAKGVLRVTIMNPLTEHSHLKALMQEITEIGTNILNH